MAREERGGELTAKFSVKQNQISQDLVKEGKNTREDSVRGTLRFFFSLR